MSMEMVDLLQGLPTCGTRMSSRWYASKSYCFTNLDSQLSSLRIGLSF